MHTMPGTGRKIRGQIVFYYSIAFLVYLLDQLSKACVGKLVLQGSSIPVIRNAFHVTFVCNTGAAFGMFREHPHLFVIIAALAIVLIGYFLARKASVLNAAEKTALSLILGGTLGNLTDRIRLGYVIDFIDLRVWPVFNLADTFITIGAVVLGLSIFIRGSEAKRK